jgi:hypothetical protein
LQSKRSYRHDTCSSVDDTPDDNAGERTGQLALLACQNISSQDPSGHPKAFAVADEPFSGGSDILPPTLLATADEVTE